MDRRVTPPKRVTWGPPPPCKQALENREVVIVVGYRIKVKYES